MEGARRDAAPFYDAFNAQPARTSTELEAMLQTPAGRQALAQDRTIAANEGRDPNALGFDLALEGNVILTSPPSPQPIEERTRHAMGKSDTVRVEPGGGRM